MGLSQKSFCGMKSAVNPAQPHLVNFARTLVYWIFKNVDELHMVQSIKNFTIRAFRRINPRVNPANTDGEIHGQSCGQTSMFILINFGNIQSTGCNF